jgi:hypothetical protein
MNVNSAYSQQNVWGAQPSAKAYSPYSLAARSGNASAKASTGNFFQNTLLVAQSGSASYSSTDREIDFSKVDPAFADRMKAKQEAIQAGLEDGSVKMKMFGDPTATENDTLFSPGALTAHMPKLSNWDMRVMTHSEWERETEERNRLIAQGKWHPLPLPKDDPETMQRASQARSIYLEAMRQSGIDPFDSDALLQFSRDAEMRKAVDELFQRLLEAV